MSESFKGHTEPVEIDEVSVPDFSLDECPVIVLFNQGIGIEYDLGLSIKNPNAESPETTQLRRAKFTQLHIDCLPLIASVGDRVKTELGSFMPPAELSPDVFTARHQQESWIALLTTQILLGEPLLLGGTTNIGDIQKFAIRPDLPFLDDKAWEEVLLKSLFRGMFGYIVSLVGEFEKPQSLFAMYRELIPEFAVEGPDPNFALAPCEALIIPPDRDYIHVKV